MSDEELQAWIDGVSAEEAEREARRKAFEKEARRQCGSWEEQQYNFRVYLYRKAIGA